MTNTNCSYLKRLQDENVVAVGYRPNNSRTLTDSLCKDDNNGGNHPLQTLVKSRNAFLRLMVPSLPRCWEKTKSLSGLSRFLPAKDRKPPRLGHEGFHTAKQALRYSPTHHKSSSPGLHTFFHYFGAGTRFDLQPLFGPPASVAAISLLSDNSFESQFLNRDK